MAQAVHEGSRYRLRVGAGAVESPLDTGLQGAAGDAVAVAADEERGVGRPQRQARGSGGTPGGAGEAGSTAVEVALDDRDELGLDRHGAVFASLTADVNHAGAFGGAADVADIGLAQLVGPKPGQQAREDKGEVALGPVGTASGALVGAHGLQECFHGGAGERLGDRLGQLRPADQRHGVRGQHLTGVEEGAQDVPG